METTEVRSIIDRAIRAAVDSGDLAERPIIPGGRTTETRPTPLAGLTAALTVAKLAQQQAHKYAVEMRGDGTSWREIADLLEIPWSEEYSRVERAYDLVASAGHTWSGDLRIYWKCGGPLGCGNDIIDRGPYNGYPPDNESGHAEGCRRLRAESAAYERECDEREQRDRVSEEAMAQITDSFGQETVKRAWYVLGHGGRYLGWSTSETLAVALALGDDATLKECGYPKRRDAMQRILSGMSNPPSNPAAWFARVRTAATGNKPKEG